jgi:hypothetical protein
MRYCVTGLLAVLVSSFVVAGCATGARGPDYEQRLKKVRAGELEVEPKKEKKLTYEDEWVHFKWSFPEGKVGRLKFRLENKSDSQVKILWDEASYVDPSGSTQQLFHEDMTFVEAEMVAQPTNVPAKATTEMVVVPEKHVKRGLYGLRFAPLVARDATGEKTVRVIMPVKYKDRVARYDFHFGISRVTEDQRNAEGTEIKKADKKTKKAESEESESSEEESAKDESSKGESVEDTDTSENSAEEQSDN